MSKTAKKNAGKPFTAGADPRRGHGLPGRSGRKPIAFTKECGRIAEETLPKMERYMRGKTPADAGYRWCFDRLAGYGKGLPTQKLELKETTHEDALDQLE